MLVDMTKIHVIGRRRDLDEVISRLHGLRAVHLVDVATDREVHVPPLGIGDERLGELQEHRFLRARLDALLALAADLPPTPEIDDGIDVDLDLAEVRRGLDRDGPVIEGLVREIDELRVEQETLPRHIAALGRLLPMLPEIASTTGYETAAVLIDGRYPEVLGALDAATQEDLGRFRCDLV